MDHHRRGRFGGDRTARLSEVPETRQPPASADLEGLSSPTSTFLADCCVVEPGRLVEVGMLFDAWKLWCSEKGRDRPGDEQAFGRDLRAVLPHLKTVQRRVEAGARPRFFEGVGLTPAYDQLVRAVREGPGDRDGF